ncbi:enoyl-CoA hydratase/isomerase family protein [Chloroflexota bacterium]
MDFETIILKKEEGIATVILNRPEIGNATNPQMYNELSSAFEDIAGDEAVRVMIITGAGRGFCGGGDTGEMGEGSIYTRLDIEALGQRIRQTTQKPIISLRKLEIPTIAMVNGFAVGGGFDIACACDIRIGSERARFTNAFVRVGLATEWGIDYYLPRIVGLGKASEILYTGRWVEAEEAERIGLLNTLVPAGDLERETMELARQLAKGPPIAIKLTKKLVKEGLETDRETTLETSAEYQAIAIASQDHREGVAAWKENREAVYRGI